MRAVLLDLEGTVYSRGRPIKGAAAALAQVRTRGLGLRFLTNIDSRPPAAITDELSELGLKIDVGEVFTPVSAASAMITTQRIIAEAGERAVVAGDR